MPSVTSVASLRIKVNFTPFLSKHLGGSQNQCNWRQCTTRTISRCSNFSIHCVTSVARRMTDRRVLRDAPGVPKVCSGFAYSVSIVLNVFRMLIAEVGRRRRSGGRSFGFAFTSCERNNESRSQPTNWSVSILPFTPSFIFVFTSKQI